MFAKNIFKIVIGVLAVTCISDIKKAKDNANYLLTHRSIEERGK